MMRKFIISGLITLFACGVDANANRNLPLDSMVITGQLSNGLTYYIRPHHSPEGRADFYLVQNVGALLEDERQNGLAHFLEHMAFNGSLHFPGKSMIRMLERHGIVYGKNLNAYTSLNETLYGLNDIPVAGKLLDSCLLMLHDWSHFLTLDRAAIEAERSVILEEWQTRRDAAFRLSAKTTPVILKGSQYAIRDIIGDTAIIRHAGADELRSFYNTWYRPDLQAIIVVGDFDATEVEQKIKLLFSDIPSPREARVRPLFEIPLSENLTFIQATDPEATQERIEIQALQKAPGPAEKDLNYLRRSLITDLFNRLMNERLYATFRSNHVPAIGASITRHPGQRGYDALTLIVVPRPGGEEKALEAAWMEKERVRKFGFTKEEIERAKTILRREAEAAYEGREKISGSQYVGKLSRHFLENEPMPDPLLYLEFVRRELPAISSEELVSCLKKWEEGHHRSVAITGPENMKKITPEHVQQIFRRVGEMDLQPYRDTLQESPLFTDQLAGGKIVKITPLKRFGAEEWTLSNGARVVFKSDDRENKVSLMAYCKGGRSHCPLEDLPAASLLPALVNSYGVGQLNAMQLDKILSVRNVSCGIALPEEYAGIGGQAPVAGMETLFQMLWLRLERPRFDAAIHKGLINRYKSQLIALKNDPFQRIRDTLNILLGNGDPRLLPLTEEQLAGITVEQVEAVYRERFANPSGFTFLIVGRANAEQLKPMVEKYIGSLSMGSRNGKRMSQPIRSSEKMVSKEMFLPLTAPRSTVIINFSAEMKYNLKHELYNTLMKDLIELRCMQELREKAGATYQVVVQESVEANPVGKCAVMVNFECTPGREKELASQVYVLFRDLADRGPIADDLKKMVRKIQAERELARQGNAFWTNVLFSWYFNGVDKADQQYDEQWLVQLTEQDVRKYVRNFLAAAKQIEFIVKPEKLH